MRHRRLVPLVMLAGVWCAKSAGASIYMHSSSSSMMYIKLTPLASPVFGMNRTGTVLLVSSDDRARGGYQITRTAPVASQNGNKIHLRISPISWHGTSEFYGTVRRGALALEIPAEGGEIHKVTLREVTEEQWNRRLSAFKARCARQAVIRWYYESFANAWNEKVSVENSLQQYWRALKADSLDLRNAQEALAAARQRLRQEEEALAAAEEIIHAAESVARASDDLASATQQLSDMQAVQLSDRMIQEAEQAVQAAGKNIRGDAKAIIDSLAEMCQRLLERAQTIRVSSGGEDRDSEVRYAASQVRAAAGDVRYAVGQVRYAASEVRQARNSARYDCLAPEREVRRANEGVVTDKGWIKRLQQRRRELDRELEAWSKVIRKLPRL